MNGVKYRPRTLGGFAGNKKLKAQIAQWFTSDSVPQAILIQGASGLGKTTLARIIAAMLNCEDMQDNKPCGKCFGCQQAALEFDCVVDNKKETLEDIVQACSTRTRTKFRVVILDEVHALTGASKSVLLKALEESGPDVYWILATNEPDKLTPTLRSRLTSLKVEALAMTEFVKLVTRVAERSGVEVDDDYLTHLYETCGSNLRMALNQLHTSDSVNAESSAEKDEAVLGMISALYSFSVQDIVRFTHKLDTAFAGMNIIELMVPLRATLDTLFSKCLLPEYRGFVTPAAKKFLAKTKSVDPKKLMQVSMALAAGERACTGIALSPSAGRSQFISAACLYLDEYQR